MPCLRVAPTEVAWDRLCVTEAVEGDFVPLTLKNWLEKKLRTKRSSDLGLRTIEFKVQASAQGDKGDYRIQKTLQDPNCTCKAVSPNFYRVFGPSLSIKNLWMDQAIPWSQCCTRIYWFNEGILLPQSYPWWMIFGSAFSPDFDFIPYFLLKSSATHTGKGKKLSRTGFYSVFQDFFLRVFS